MLQAYKEYWIGYLDFKGKTSVRGYWLAFFANFILGFTLSLFVAMGYSESPVFMSAFTCICLLPGLVIVVQRRRNAGFHRTNLFWAFPPLTRALELSANKDVVMLPDGRFSQAAFRQTSAVNDEHKKNSPGVLLVRFSIEKLNELSGSYGFQSGKLIGQAVPAALLEGMIISDGDSAATLHGSEYVCIVAIASNDINALKKIVLPLIIQNTEIRKFGTSPVTTIVTTSNEPLAVNGRVQGGKIIGKGGWCASGFMAAWEEAK